MNKKLIIFDLDNTLFKSRDSYGAILAEIIAEKWSLDKEEVLIKMKDAEQQIDKDSFDSINDYYRKYGEAFLRNLFGNIEQMEEFNELVAEMKRVAPERLKTYEGVRETLEILKKKGYLLAILTGTWGKKIKDFSGKEYAKEKRMSIERLLKNSEMNEIIDRIFVSLDIGVVKPHPDSFKMVLEHFNVLAEESVMVGDNEADIKASEVGITSILFNPKKRYSGEAKPDFEFKNYCELVDIITGLN